MKERLFKFLSIILLLSLITLVVSCNKAAQNAFKDPSTIDTKKLKPKDLPYRVNKNGINLPSFYKLPSTNPQFTLSFEKVGSKIVDIPFDYSINGWQVFGESNVSKGEDFGIVIDFNNGYTYQMPKDDVARYLSTFSPDNDTKVKVLYPNKKVNPTFTKMVVVDSSNYGKKELDSLALLNSQDLYEKNMLQDLPTDPGIVPTANLPKVDSKSTFHETNKNAVFIDKPFLTATANGQYDRIEKMLQNGASMSEVDLKTGNNALMLALLNGDENIANLLLDKGINPFIKNNMDQTALHIASNYGLYNIAKRLLDSGVNVNDIDKNGNTPLMYASASPNNFLTELLLSKGANIRAKNKDGEDAILIASRAGNTKTVDNLISKGASLTTVDNEGNGVIMKAVDENNKWTLDKLIKAEAPVDIKNNKGVTPLLRAVQKGYADIATDLIDAGADINGKDLMGQTPLMVATVNGDAKMVNELLKHNPNTTLTNKEDKTAYALAKDKGLGQIERTLASGMKKYDDASITLFDTVAKNDIDNTIKAIENGANVNAKDKGTGNTPIFTAVANNYTNMTKLLIAKGANVNEQNGKGNIPLIIAVTATDLNMVDILIGADSKVDTPNNNGDTALIWATKIQNMDMVRSLLKAGANPNHRNKDGISAYLIAFNDGNKDMMALLQAAGGYR